MWLDLDETAMPRGSLSAEQTDPRIGFTTQCLLLKPSCFLCLSCSQNTPNNFSILFSPGALILQSYIASDAHRTLHSHFAAVLEQPVSSSHVPVFCHPLSVLGPADLGLCAFLSLFSDMCCKILCKGGMCRPSLPLAQWQSQCSGRAGVVALALPCLQHLVPSPVAFQRESLTSGSSASSIPLSLHIETQILFQGVKCVQKMGLEGPESAMDVLINAFTSDGTCAFGIFVTV